MTDMLCLFERKSIELIKKEIIKVSTYVFTPGCFTVEETITDLANQVEDNGGYFNNDSTV